MGPRRVGLRMLAGSLALGSLVLGALVAPGAAGVTSAAPANTILHVLSDIGAVDVDPSAANTLATRSLLSGLVIRSLTQLVYDPKARQMVLEPDLATSLGTHNATYTSWTFTLRRNVRFENGKLVRPIDVKYGIERSFDSATFPHGPRYSNDYFLHGHTYRGPYRSGTKYGGVVISGQQITLKMAKPFPDLPYYLTFPAMSPIPPGKASDPVTYQKHPWATGPYMFRAYTPGHSLLLWKNPYWNAAADPYRSQRVSGINISMDMPKDQIDQAMLQHSGIGPTSVTLNSVLPADYSRFMQQAPARLLIGGNRCVDMFDPDNRKITDSQVRRALGWAYPYQAAWAAGGGIQGVTRVPATNLEPPGTPGRKVYNPLAGHTPGTTDPAKAKAILTAAHKLHTVVSFAYRVDVPQSVGVKNVLVQALAAAGFKPEPFATTKARYVHHVLKNPNAPVNIRAVTTCSPFPSGGSVLVPEFHTTHLQTTGFGENYTAFSHQAVDNSMKRIQLLASTQQPASWSALDKTIQTKYFPTVVTAYHGVALMRGSRVQGFVLNTVLGMPTWNTLFLRP